MGKIFKSGIALLLGLATMAGIALFKYSLQRDEIKIVQTHLSQTGVRHEDNVESTPLKTKAPTHTVPSPLIEDNGNKEIKSGSRTKQFQNYPLIQVYDDEVHIPNPRDPFQQHGVKQVEEHFHRYFLTYPQAHCGETIRFGRLDDGGWDVCVAEPYKPKQDDCIVYSFGIGNDFSFDDGISKHFGCKNYAFDPSMIIRDHNRSKLVEFRSVGLSADDQNKVVGRTIWRMKTLESIISMLHHQNKIIDVLKFDIETAEWGALKQMVKTGVLKNVKQIMFEIHCYYKNETQLNNCIETLHPLYESGFRRFRAHPNNQDCHYKSPFVKHRDRVKCYEVYYININFLS